MTRLRVSLILGLAAMAHVLVAQQRTVYVPVIWASRTVPAAGGAHDLRSVYLISDVFVFNSSGTPTQFSVPRVFGAGGAQILSGTPTGVYPLGAVPYERGCSPPSGCVELHELVLGPGLLVNSTLERGNLYSNCPNGCTSPGEFAALVSQGRIAMPVFDAVFPASATAFAGDVMPFGPGKTLNICPSLNQGYVRRINLTLFNAGTSPATFSVKGLKSTRQPGEVVYTGTFQLPAETVRQFNRFYQPPVPDCSPEFVEHLFFTITADQPFLAYVSTAFDDPEPGAITNEIYPARLVP